MKLKGGSIVLLIDRMFSKPELEERGRVTRLIEGDRLNVVPEVQPAALPTKLDVVGGPVCKATVETR